MSFVGPRPEVPGLVNQEDPLWQEVLAARPGITDPVTLSLRNEEDLLAAAGTDPETYYRDILQPFKLRGYKEYLCFRTPWRDLLIIAKTLLAVILPFTTRTPSSEEIRGFPENDE
jgi:lipopolysaccharide/colanic/teichoic acid biosynthesis glycosyltransferase